MSQIVTVLLALTLAGTALAGSPPADAAKPRVRFTTNLGTFVVELEPAKAPKTVENFLRYVRDGFYDGTVFHRVVPGFVVQGGGFTADLVQKPTRAPIPNEAGNGLSNVRGTLAMARTSDPDSATAQFYINLRDNTALDRRDGTPAGAGYCVFGRVVEGMDVVDAIGRVPTHTAAVKDPRSGRRYGMRDVPAKPVVIEKAEILGAPGSGDPAH